MTKRHPGDPIPPRSSQSPDRRTVHLNWTAREYAILTQRAAIADLSRPRYIREVTLAFEIYRTTSPTEILANTTAAIACVRTLASSPAVQFHFNTWRRFEAAMAELHAKTAELERHTERVAALLALLPPTQFIALESERRLPGPGAAIWRSPGTDTRTL